MKITFIFLILLLCTGFLTAQNIYHMGDVEMTTDCQGIFYDDGGNGFPGFYSNQLGQDPQVFTICPENAGCIVMDFHSFVTERASNLSPGDVLYAYDGPNTSAPLIGAYHGALALSDHVLGRITAGSGCLTLVFDENGGFSTIGWEAEWTCFVNTCLTMDDLKPPTDCVNSVLVCDNEALNYNSNGAGEEELLSQGIQDCITSGETQSLWLKINISEFALPNMPLTFTISPKPGGEDYDFAIYGSTKDCGDLGQPIRCTYAEATFVETLLTGLRAGETDFSESPTLDNEGNNANGFLAPIMVNPGEQYFIMVNNFSTSNVGFDMIWGDEVLDNNLLDCDLCEHLVLMPDYMEVCVGEEFELVPDVYKGSGFFDYQWSPSIEGVSFFGQNPVTVQLPDDFVGEFTISLDVEDIESLNCVQHKEIVVDVVGAVGVSIENLETSYCSDAPIVDLVGIPEGGIFEGNGIENAQFNPSIAGIGTHSIQYTYTDPLSECVSRSEQIVEVVGIPEAPNLLCTGVTTNDITLEWADIEGADAYELSYTINAGEMISQTLSNTVTTFTLMGLNANTPVAFHLLATNEECGEGETATITCSTNDCPTIEVTFTELQATYCKSDDSFLLEGTPLGGTFSLDGNPIENEVNPANLEIGNHILTYTYDDSTSGCSYTNFKNFQVEDVPAMPTVICGDSSLECVTFQWEQTANTLDYRLIVFLNGEDYQVEITTETSYTVCGLTQGDEITLDVAGRNNCGSSMIASQNCSYECSPIEAQILGATEYCQTDALVPFQGVPMGGIFTFSDGTLMADGLFPIDESGIYTIFYTYTEADGCEYQATNNVEVFPHPSALFTASGTTILQGESITFTAEEQEGVTYLWTINGEIVANTFEYTFTSEDAGNYLIALEVLSNEGCAANSEFLEVIVEVDTVIEAHPFFTSLQIHPNPAKDLLQVFLTTSISKTARLQWYNAQGQLIASEDLQVEAGMWNYSVDVSDFAAGMYYLHLQTEEGMVVEKVLVVR